MGAEGGGVSRAMPPAVMFRDGHMFVKRYSDGGIMEVLAPVWGLRCRFHPCHMFCHHIIHHTPFCQLTYQPVILFAYLSSCQKLPACHLICQPVACSPSLRFCAHLPARHLICQPVITAASLLPHSVKDAVLTCQPGTSSCRLISIRG